MDGFMDGLPWVAGAIVGIILGAVAAFSFRISAREQRGRTPLPPPSAEEGLVRVLSVLKSAAIILDADDEVVRASPPAYAIGLVRSDALVHPAIADLVNQVRGDGVIREAELELPRGLKTASQVLLQLRVAPLGSGQILVLAEDRTEAARTETIRRDFVVNVTHELQAPVAAVAKLATQVWEVSDDAGQVREYSALLRAEAGRLASLVREIVELTRLQATAALAEVRTVSVSQVIAEAIESLAPAAAAKNLMLTAAGGEDALVYGDQHLLVTALRNLLDNAIAYSPSNARVGIGVREQDGLVVIDVVDQGMGMTAAQQERVFERFYRTDPARSQVPEGTGLGLSLVKHIAAEHGGEVGVWSAPGRGATFTLRLPAADG